MITVLNGTTPIGNKFLYIIKQKTAQMADSNINNGE